MNQDIQSILDEASMNLVKDVRDIKRFMRLEEGHDGVHVWVVVSHEDCEFNRRIEISTQYGSPLTPEVHDTVRDAYYVEGVGIHEIGYIPVNYILFLEESDFELNIPLPFSVIKRYMTEEQKRAFFEWKASFKGAEFKFRFFQALEYS